MDQQHLAGLLQVAAADVEVVVADGLDHLVEGEVVLQQAIGIDPHLVLLLKPPQPLISAVPGTVRKAGLMTQSWTRAQLR